MKRIPLRETLLVCLAGSTSLAAAASLSISLREDGVRVEWPGGGILESSDSPSGPWRELPAAVSPHRISATTDTTYFRLKTVMVLLSTAKAGSGQGSIVSEPPGIHCGTECSALLPLNTAVTLTAVPEPGSVFVGWSGACSGTGTGQVLMGAPKSVTATFILTSAFGLVNGDFELGPNIGWTQEPGPLIYRARDYGVEPYSGDYVAYLGPDEDDRHIATLSQRVTLPNTWPLYLNFALWLYSEELNDVGYYDWFGFYIDGEPIIENTRLATGNTGGDGWRRLAIDISTYAGRNVVIAFQIGSNAWDPLASWALLDELSLGNQPW